MAGGSTSPATEAGEARATSGRGLIVRAPVPGGGRAARAGDRRKGRAVRSHVWTPMAVCEVLSPSTARIDRRRKLPIYARAGIPFAWLVDPVERLVEVLRLREGCGRSWRSAATSRSFGSLRSEQSRLRWRACGASRGTRFPAGGDGQVARLFRRPRRAQSRAPRNGVIINSLTAHCAGFVTLEALMCVFCRCSALGRSRPTAGHPRAGDGIALLLQGCGDQGLSCLS